MGCLPHLPLSSASPYSTIHPSVLPVLSSSALSAFHLQVFVLHHFCPPSLRYAASVPPSDQPSPTPQVSSPFSIFVCLVIYFPSILLLFYPPSVYPSVSAHPEGSHPSVRSSSSSAVVTPCSLFPLHHPSLSFQCFYASVPGVHSSLFHPSVHANKMSETEFLTSGPCDLLYEGPLGNKAISRATVSTSQLDVSEPKGTS